MHFHTIPLLLYTLFGILFLVNRLYSQEQDLETLLDYNLEKLMNVTIVTASKTPQKLGEVPATVRVITKEQIAENGYFSLEEALGSARIPVQEYG